MKAYTDIEQSKKLAEILPLESADMSWVEKGNTKRTWYDAENRRITTKYEKKYYIPCWSLAALLEIIPKHIKEFNVLRIDIDDKDFSIWYDEIGFGVNNELPDITTESPIDACYEMIVTLKEKGLL